MTEAHEMTQAEREELFCARANDRPRPHTVVRRLPRHRRQPQAAHHQQEGEKMTDIDVDKIKTGDRATAYISAWERRFGGGRYVTGTAEVFTRNRVIWVDDPLGGGSVMVRNSDGRLVDGVRIVSHTPADQVELQDAINRTLSRPEVRDALTLLAEPESAWEKARVIRTPKGILCRDPQSGWWIDHEGGNWGTSDVDDMDDVTVVVDAEGRNVAADAVTHLLRKTEDEKHAAENRAEKAEKDHRMSRFWENENYGQLVEARERIKELESETANADQQGWDRGYRQGVLEQNGNLIRQRETALRDKRKAEDDRADAFQWNIQLRAKLEDAEQQRDAARQHWHQNTEIADKYLNQFSVVADQLRTLVESMDNGTIGGRP